MSTTDLDEDGARARWPASPATNTADLTIAALTIVLVVLFVPASMFPSWSLRFALLLAIGPIGLAVLVADVAKRDRPSMVLLAALLWAVVSGLVSGAPRSALLGSVGRDLSVLTVALSAGLWSLGRRVSSGGASLVTRALVWSTVVNAALAIFQVLAAPESGSFRLIGGRPTGLLVNPVYLGALASAALAVAVASASERPRWEWVSSILLLGCGASLSGSRVALVASVLVSIAIALRLRRPVTWMAGGLAVLSLGAGVMVDRIVGAGRNAVDRLGADGGGRTSVWGYGVDAWLDRPIVGHGLGRFRAATQSRFTSDFVRQYVPNDLAQAWFDPHNLVIGLLVGVGVVGTTLIGCWLVTSAARISGPIAWALVPLALHWMLQPVSLFTMPLAMLLLGVGGAGQRADVDVSPVDTQDGSERGWSRRSVVLLCIGAASVVLGSIVFVADVALYRAVQRSDADGAAAVAPWLGHDAVVDGIVAQLYGRLEPTEENVEAELRWRRLATSAEPDRPYWWAERAASELRHGRVDAAATSAERALALQRWNIRSLLVALGVAVAQGDEDAAARFESDLCELDVPLEDCPGAG